VVLGEVKIFGTHDSGCPFVLADEPVWDEMKGVEKKCNVLRIKGVGGGKETLCHCKRVRAVVAEAKTDPLVYRSSLGGRRVLFSDEAASQLGIVISGLPKTFPLPGRVR